MMDQKVLHKLLRALAAPLCALVLAPVCACDETAVAHADAGTLDFTIGGTVFRASSGTVQTTAGALTFWLTDQADSCCAVLFTPQAPLTALKLQVQPPTDGTTTVTIVSKASPAAGEAVGGLTVTKLGVQQASHAAASGKVSWTAGGNGYYTITALDVGFADTVDRLALAAQQQVVVPVCTGCSPP
jgi:hypothetical protein